MVLEEDDEEEGETCVDEFGTPFSPAALPPVTIVMGLGVADAVYTLADDVEDTAEVGSEGRLPALEVATRLSLSDAGACDCDCCATGSGGVLSDKRRISASRTTCCCWRFGGGLEDAFGSSPAAGRAVAGRVRLSDMSMEDIELEVLRCPAARWCCRCCSCCRPSSTGLDMVIVDSYLVSEMVGPCDG